MQVIDPRELNDLAEFASKGGIASTVAQHDCVAELPDQLMFITGDTLILLRELDDVVLASCEGVVGWIKKGDVDFGISTGTTGLGIPDTIISSPTPPTRTIPLPQSQDASEEGEGEGEGLEVDSRTPDSRRASGPFDLGTPNHSPGLESSTFFEDPPAMPRQQEIKEEDRNRDSVGSSASSALGGIGGFMLGVGADESMQSTKDDSPPSTSIDTPYDQSFQTNPSASASTSNSVNDHANVPEKDDSDDDIDRESWDIYGDYARESMYHKRSTRDIKAMSGMDQAFNLAKALQDIPSPPSKIPERWNRGVSTSPTATRHVPAAQDTPTAERLEGRSFATELRLKIQKEREEKENAASTTEAPPAIPPRSTSRLAPPGPSLFIANADTNDDDKDEQTSPKSVEQGEEAGNDSLVAQSSEVGDSEASTIIDTPVAINGEGESAARHPALEEDKAPKSEEEMLEREDTTPIPAQKEDSTPTAYDRVLLASPIPLEDTQPRRPSQVLDTPNTRSPTISIDPPAETEASTPTTKTSPEIRSGMYSPSLDLPNANMIDLPPQTSTPRLSPREREPKSPWSPSSPASPHSITATRHAVQVARSVSESHASGGAMPTLVGKTEMSLLGSKGPVPITFLVDGAGIHRSSPSTAPAREGLGLGMPSTSLMGRISPVNSIVSSSSIGGIGSINPRRAATSPLAGNGESSPRLPIPLAGTADPADSRFPTTYPRDIGTPEIKQTYTPVIAPSSPEQSNTARMSAIYPRKVRSRSFGATMARAMGRGKKEKEKEKEKVPDIPVSKGKSLVIDTSLSSRGGGLKTAPVGEGRGLSIANMPSPIGSTFSNRDSAPSSPNGSTFTKSDPWNRAGSPIGTQPRKASAPAIIPSVDIASPPPIPLSKTTTIDSQHSLSLAKTQSRTPSFSSTFKSPKTPNRKPSNTLPSPAAVSHTDFAEATIKADGLDFEIVQPRRGLLSPDSPASLRLDDQERPGIKRSETSKSDMSGVSARSLPLPETDEWGFLKDQSPTPEMFQSRNMGSDHRAAEGKWLTIVATPVPSDGAPKKARKLASESGIPASLRGKVWAWFLGPVMPKREPGKYGELSKGGQLDEKLELEISRVYSDHSVFSSSTSTGQADLRSLLLAYQNSHSTPTPTTMPLIGGMLLIHCVVEDAFYLLQGIMDGLMREYYLSEKGIKVDSAVFTGLLAGSEKALSRKFKDLEIHPRSFLSKWYNQLFIRCLPWPTALRVIDALLAEGPRFLLIASLSILTLSRDRILALQTSEEILSYLNNLPQDALLLPENYMKACSEVKFKEDDYRRLRAGVEKEMV